MDRLCVLILECQTSSLNFLVRELQQLGVRSILEATGGEEALALLRVHGSVDIVICGSLANGGSGLEFLRRASMTNAIRAAALCVGFPPDQRPAVRLMAQRCGFNLLGKTVASSQDSSLQEVLTEYDQFSRTSACRASAASAFRLADITRGIALGEFQALYQPLLRLTDNSMVSVEVLSIWEYPENRVLNEYEFSTALAQHGQEKKVFIQTFQHALRLHACYCAGGEELKLELRLTRMLLKDKRLIEYVQRYLLYHNVLAGSIIFSIAEAELLHDYTFILSQIYKLKEIGCQLALHDFTGKVLSLAVLCEVAFHQIKLNPEFISNGDQISRSLMSRALTSMATSLPINIVVTGVCNEAQHNMLYKLGFDCASGPYYSEALTGYQLFKRLKNPVAVGAAS